MIAFYAVVVLASVCNTIRALNNGPTIHRKYVTKADLEQMKGLADGDYYDQNDLTPYNGCEASCGIENNANSVRIINGTETARNRYPWMTLVHTTRNGRTSQCGGALINSSTVLTAGHCVDNNASAITVYLGCHDTGMLSRCLSRPARAFAIHPDWTSRNLGDIAVVYLREPVVCNVNIQRICLPQASMIVAPRLAKLIGWGLTNSPQNNGQVARRLQEAEMTIQTDRTCREAARQAQVSYTTPNFICTSDNNQKSGCFGDSGGPLMLQENGVNFVVGTVHAGPPNCTYPNLFGNVRHYLGWINDSTRA